MKELLLGCGNRTAKHIFLKDKQEFENLVRLDNNPDRKPDVLHDLTLHPLPFPNNEFDEIHAYEVLEHLAYQGDYEFFFKEFSEYWRILKPGGHFFATVPSIKSRWCWGDPSHRRVIMPETLNFLCQKTYEQEHTPISDFRYLYKADFKIKHVQETDETTLFVLEAVK